MTATTSIRAVLEAAQNNQLAAPKRLEHLNEFMMRCKRAKVGAAKTAGDVDLVALREQLDAEIEAAKVQKKAAKKTPAVKAVKEKAEKTPRVPKDGVVALVKRLLMTEKSYQEICDEAHSNFADCKTTVKSVSSIARDMRKAGIEVPSRRVQAA